MLPSLVMRPPWTAQKSEPGRQWRWHPGWVQHSHPSRGIWHHPHRMLGVSWNWRALAFSRAAKSLANAAYLPHMLVHLGEAYVGEPAALANPQAAPLAVAAGPQAGALVASLGLGHADSLHSRRRSDSPFGADFDSLHRSFPIVKKPMIHWVCWPLTAASFLFWAHECVRTSAGSARTSATWLVTGDVGRVRACVHLGPVARDQRGRARRRARAGVRAGAARGRACLRTYVMHACVHAWCVHT